MATQPTLGGTTLPYPSEYTESYIFRGSAVEMADGSVVWDLLTATAKRTFTLSFKNLSTTQRNTVHTAWGTAKTASVTFVSPTNTSYTVTRGPGQDALDWTAIVDGTGNLRWSATMMLREV